jgi:hypothetical protein
VRLLQSIFSFLGFGCKGLYIEMLKSTQKMLTPKRYFHLNQNANYARMIVVPLCPQSHISVKATTFNNNTIFLSISMHDINQSIILSRLGGLPNYMALILEICEIINVLEDSKSLKKKTKKKVMKHH